MAEKKHSPDFELRDAPSEPKDEPGGGYPQDSWSARQPEIVLELAKAFEKLIKENIQKPMEELVQKIRPAPSPLERILMDDRLFERAKALGMFGGDIRQKLIELELKLMELEIRIEKLEGKGNG